jgi:hypothetical protein
MAEKISVCGLDCGACPAYQATQKNDDAERKKVAETWSKEYGADIKPEDINCDGCTSKTGPYFSNCNVCEIRKCGLEHSVENCAHCGDYACDKLTKFFEMVPDAKTRLDGVKAGLGA